MPDEACETGVIQRGGVDADGVQDQAVVVGDGQEHHQRQEDRSAEEEVAARNETNHPPMEVHDGMVLHDLVEGVEEALHHGEASNRMVCLQGDPAEVTHHCMLIQGATLPL